MKNKIKMAMLALIMVFGFSCSDLKEEILDESLSGGKLQSDIIAGSVAPAYALLPDFFLHTKYFALQEISTDEAILPYRGGTDWGDNGIYIDMHRHTYTPSHVRIKDCWDNLTKMISRTVTAINVLTPLAKTDADAKIYLAEMKALRAYYNMVLLDLYGLSFVKEDPNEVSKILRGNDAVEYIRTELESAQNEVSTTTGPGRITQGAVWGLLARLHLNAAVWREPYATFNFKNEDMDKVIDYTSKVISSGKYQLSPEFFEIFDDENHNNKELIFAADQRPDLNGHNRMAYFSLSGDMFPLPNFPNANGTDGPGITSDFYRTWVQAYGADDPALKDARFFKENLVIPVDSFIAGDKFEINRGILRGQQYGLITTKYGQPFERGPNGTYKIGKLRNITRADKTKLVIHTETIDFTTAGSGYSTGYRVEKYEFSKLSDSGRNKGQADIIILRLADIYLMRAEAKMRKGDAAGALSDVNAVRASRTARPTQTPPALAQMTLDVLFRERGFEFYWEHQRRTDMIRFGKYEGTWAEKTDNDVKKRLFPIPQSAIDGASANTGYLVQNDGY
ncbi:MAG: RagB/SusD family nutrient uptake outer membrane protein [Prolixibacteraceae bacterium]|nr:RagB/SusD family nutrient uptake outer membrane protein [Prolixibacteraceae bacterium]